MLNGITLAIVMILILLTAGFVLTVLISAFLVPLFKTPRDVLEEIVTIMDLTKNDVLVDLGSGDGRLILQAYEQSRCKCFGYDISPMMMIHANTNKNLTFPFTKDIVFQPEDIFKVSLKDATKIYCYLEPKSLDILKTKLKEFVEKEGEIFSYKYPIEGLENGKEIILSNDVPLYIYRG